MIFDRIFDIRRYEILASHADIVIGQINELSKINEGDWVFLNEKVKVIKLAVSSVTEEYEFHKKYTDLHVTISGTDLLSLGNKSSAKYIGSFDYDRDFQLCETDSVATFRGIAGFFSVFGPGELHKSKFTEPGTEKLVFKIFSDVS